MKIGIDLDDVVFEFTKTFLDFYSRRYGKLIKFEEVKTYYFEEIFDLPLEKVIDLIREMVAEGVAGNMLVCDYAQESILSLADNHEIIFLTSRVIREGTLDSLKKLFPEIDFKLIYSSNSYARTNGKTKGEICKEEGIDVMIEDSKEYASEIAVKGTRVLLLDKPWNKEYQNHTNIVKTNDWKEVLDKI